MFAEAVHTELPFTTPILSDAVGVHPDQVAEHRRMHPEQPINEHGQVIFTSHSQRKKFLKKIGFADRRGYN